MQQEMQDASWGTPLNPNGVEVGMPTTGDRRDIGWVPGPYALWYESRLVYSLITYLKGSFLKIGMPRNT